LKPNYIDLGLSYPLSNQLRAEIERQLVKDLNFYHIQKDIYKFDWSDSCIEGKMTTYMGEPLDNFSGIAVFDQNDQRIADGWLEYIHEENFLLIYWDFLDSYTNEQATILKSICGIPLHIFDQISDQFKEKYRKELLNNINDD